MNQAQALERLVELVPPPFPIPSPAGDWDEFERRNGFPAPPDYRALVDRYGTCGFGWYESTGEWIHLLDPFDPSESLVEKSDHTRRRIRGFQRRFPDQEPDWPMWPDAGGFLPWAATIDGDDVGWHTIGPPEWWGTWFYARDGEHRETSSGVCEFLLELMTSDIPVHEEDPEPVARAFAYERKPSRAPQPPMIELSVQLTGMPMQIDRAALPDGDSLFGLPMSERKEAMDRRRATFDAATAPAQEVFEQWRKQAEGAGLRVHPLGWIREHRDTDLRPMFQVFFPPDHSDAARTLVIELAERFGVGVHDVRDIEHLPWWPDLSS